MYNDEIYLEAYTSIIENTYLDEYDIVTELFTESGVNRLSLRAIKMIEEIKNTKPNEFTGPAELKKYIDKNYDILIKTATLLEKDIKKLRAAEIRDMIIGLSVYVSGFIMMGIAGAGIGVTIGGILIFAGMAYAVVTSIISYIRMTKDYTILKDLNKIKTSLKHHINDKNIDNSVKRKISGIIEKIDDAQEESNQKFIMTKEYTNMNDELDLIKLNIYESYDNGEITYGEKEYLLEQVDYMYEASNFNKKVKLKYASKGAAKGAAIGAGVVGASTLISNVASINNYRKSYDAIHQDELMNAQAKGPDALKAYVIKREKYIAKHIAKSTGTGMAAGALAGGSRGLLIGTNNSKHYLQGYYDAKKGE